MDSRPRKASDRGRLKPGVIYELTSKGPRSRVPAAVLSIGDDPRKFVLPGPTFDPGEEPVPGYHLVSWIGRSDKSEVWEASAPGGFSVALKFVAKDGRAEVDALRPFASMAGVRHSNLLTTFGVWDLEDHLVVGMELADGTVLDRFVEAVAAGKPGIPFWELATYIEQAARGLDFLSRSQHSPRVRSEAGSASRKLKARNLLLVGGSVKLGDYWVMAPPRRVWSIPRSRVPCRRRILGSTRPRVNILPTDRHGVVLLG